MEPYYDWLNSLVNKNKTEFTEWNQLKWLNSLQAQKAQEKRDELIARLDGNWLFRKTKPYHNQISDGCKLCGLGQWSCLFITGKCNASCFYCPTTQLSDHVPATQNLSFNSAQAYAEYLKHFNFKGVSFSGGEPLLYFDRVLDYLKQVRRKCRPETYVWIYSNGILGETQKFRKLAAAGLNEIRFDIGATAYSLEKVKLAKGIIPNVTVEIPAIPEQKERIMRLLPEMMDSGVTNLNLHQLRLTKHNVRNLSKRNYTYISAEQPIVLESELAALEILSYAREHSLDIGINYCSFHFKNRFQKAGFRKQVAGILANDNDVITQNGYLREYKGNSIAYKSMHLADEKPAMRLAQELELPNKKYYFFEEQILSPTQLNEKEQKKVEAMFLHEPTEVPSNPLLFRIWQMEYIEKGLREY